VDTGEHPVHGLCVAVDGHYLRSDGARAAAVVAADTLFSQVVAEHIAVVPEVPRYQPGEFCRRELPPLRAVLEGIGGLGLPVILVKLIMACSGTGGLWWRRCCPGARRSGPR
jgi:deoxyinosine 3'endonuclease (endonuclease V)